MKVKNFLMLIFGIVALMLFALGMCMCLVEGLGSMKLGIALGVVGLVIGAVLLLAWRKAQNKAPIKLNKRAVLISLYAIVSALVLGLGICLCLVWCKYLVGISVGFAGILMLIFLVPIVKGFHK